MYCNAILWGANALTWGLYAGSMFMAIALLALAVGSVWIAVKTDAWRW